MPLYEYQCGQCGRFEVIRKFSDPPLDKCPTCGNEIQKLVSSPAIQFKGAGWYVNDYAKKSSGESGSSDSSSKSDSSNGKKESAKETGKETGSKSESAAPATTTPSTTKKTD